LQIVCLLDGVDRRQCCVSHGVSGICLDVCSGNRVSNPLQFLSCAQHLNSYASCYDIPLNRSGQFLFTYTPFTRKSIHIHEA